MTKIQFLLELNDKLCGLPQADIEERLNFYSEMIEDRMEEGLSEEQAVQAIGSTDDIVAQILDETPLVKIAREKIKPNRRLKAWETVLLAVGAPVWFSLAVAAIAVLLALYVSLWAVIISLWAVFASVCGGIIGGLVGGTIVAVTRNMYAGLALVAAGVVCAGLAVFVFLGCKAVSNATVSLTKKMVLGIKNRCVGKEKAV